MVLIALTSVNSRLKIYTENELLVRGGILGKYRSRKAQGKFIHAKRNVIFFWFFRSVLLLDANTQVYLYSQNEP